MSEERRLDERVTINREFASFEALTADFLADVSEAGAFIRTSTPRRVGEVVRFRLAIVDGGGLETFEGEGIVRRVSEDPRGMALEFTNIAAHSRHVLLRILGR